MPLSHASEIVDASISDEGGRARQSSHLPAICWRQWRTERALRRRGVDFRTTDPVKARQAYAAMTPAEFTAINGRQAWANRRTILRSLAGLLPDRPLRAIDLGSGIGSSTMVLADALPPGSMIIGIEFASPLVEIARSQAEASSSASRQKLTFVVGSVTETYCHEEGQPIGDASVDVVNASGIIGHHLDPPDAERAVDEITRVLKSKGLAALDVGPRFPVKALAELMTSSGYSQIRRTRSNLFDRTGQIVFRKR